MYLDEPLAALAASLRRREAQRRRETESTSAPFDAVASRPEPMFSGDLALARGTISDGRTRLGGNYPVQAAPSAVPGRLQGMIALSTMQGR